MKRTGAVLVVGVLAVSACGGGSKNEGARAREGSAGASRSMPQTSQDIVARLRSAKLGCDDYAGKPPTSELGPSAKETGDCTIVGQKANISVYADEGSRLVAFQAGQAAACALAKDRIVGRAVAAGGPWMIGLDNGEPAQTAKVADALGGKVETFRCP